MKTIFKFSAAAILLLAGCVQEQNTQDPELPGEEVIIRATAEPATRTSLLNGGTQVYWEKGDRIGVYFKGEGSIFTSKQTDDLATVADFSGTLTTLVGANEGAGASNYIWGLYPYYANATSDGNSVTTSIPMTQTARAGSFGKEANVAIARSNGFDLAFYNVCGGIRFTLKQEGITRVILKTKGGVPVAGQGVKIAFENGEPKVQGINTPYYEVHLYAPAGENGTTGTFQPGVWYYMTLLPCQLSSGFSLEFRKGNESATRTTTNAFTVKRGIFGSIENIDEGAEFPDERAVDLGLSVKWAEMNVGASVPEESGYYYAWGETEPKSWYIWGTYQWADGSERSLNKYNVLPYFGIVDYRTLLEPEDDAAHLNWGGDWRMPTGKEWEELINGCTWEWTTQNNVPGYKVSGKKSGYTNKSIFIPAAGFKEETRTMLTTSCFYWSSTVKETQDLDIYGPEEPNLFGDDEVIELSSTRYRYKGQNVRPVYPSPTSVSWVKLDPASLDLLVGETASLTPVIIPETATNWNVTWSTLDASVATVDRSGNVSAAGVGKTQIMVTTVDGERKGFCTVTVTAPVREAVDMGLSVKWANFNVGSESYGGKGDFFAWGEIAPKSQYSWANYKYRNSAGTLFKYNSTVDGRELLGPEDDAAYKNWGSDWRIPTTAEWDELMKSENCKWEWTSYGGQPGYKVTSKISGYTDKWIFLPAANYKDYEETYHPNGSIGCYWTSNLSDDASDPAKAYWTYFTDNIPYMGSPDVKLNKNARNAGAPVRAVAVDPSVVSWVSLNPYSVNIQEGETAMVNATVLPETATNKVLRWESDDPSIAVVTGEGIVRGIAPGQTMIHATAVSGLKRASCLVRVEESTVKAVDLGLRVKWANVNLGATAPEHSGDYYAWGETQPKRQYDWSTYWWCNNNEQSLRLNRYVTDQSYGTVDMRETLEPEQDAAYVNWGENWRMPTWSELEGLLNNCTWEWTTLNRVNGYKVTSDITGYTDQSIFLPAAGYYYNTGFKAGSGLYWSSDLSTNDNKFSPAMAIQENAFFLGGIERFRGLTIRPVAVDPTKVSWIKLDQTSVDLLAGETVTLTATVLPETATNKAVFWNSSNTNVATVDANGIVTAKKMGVAVITATDKATSTKKAGCTVNVTLEELDAVDLGLSVKWATLNLGATTISDYGECYAWGETQPRTGMFAWSNYLLANGSSSTLTAYKDSSTPVLSLSDDAARVQWGGNWRMPTKTEMEELLDPNKCKWEKAQADGKTFFKISSKVSGYTSNFIYIPVAGYQRDELTLEGSAGYYWTSSLNLNDPTSAYYLSAIYSNAYTSISNFARCYGLRIRPVMPKN